MAEVLFYDSGYPAQLADDRFRETWPGLQVRRHLFPGDTPFRVIDQHLFFAGQGGLTKPVRPFLGDPKDIRRNRSIDHCFAQAEVGVDDRFRALGISGIDGIHNPSGLGLDHPHTAHTHGNIFFLKTFAYKIENGPRGEFTSHDFFIFFSHILPGDIQDGPVLAGKGKPAVFAQGAASKGNPDRPACFSSQILIALNQDFFQEGGNGFF